MLTISFNEFDNMLINSTLQPANICEPESGEEQKRKRKRHVCKTK
jgi:hypothetical protein